MTNDGLILKNPLRILRDKSEDILDAGGFGAVLARAGVGKTAFLVQIALDSMLRDKNVLHVSVNDPVKKVSLWYKEVFGLIALHFKIEDADTIFEKLLPKRFIMTFAPGEFKIAKLEERLIELVKQDVFYPKKIIIDGFPFEKEGEELIGFKKFAENQGFRVWFAILTHRDENSANNVSLPENVKQLSEFFEFVIRLDPEEKNIYIKILKSKLKNKINQSLKLDPATMLITN